MRIKDWGQVQGLRVRVGTKATARARAWARFKMRISVRVQIKVMASDAREDKVKGLSRTAECRMTGGYSRPP